MKRWIALIWTLCTLLTASATSIVFINPGKSDEAYWLTAARAAQAAATDFGFTLEVRYAERQHDRVVEIARSIIERPKEQRPDFVIFSNDYASAPELLRMFDEAGIKTLLAFSKITNPAAVETTGLPRQKYKTWLGSIEPHAEDAGYLTAKLLISEGRRRKLFGADGKLHLIAIGGDKSTPTSIKRDLGLSKAVQEASDAVLDQEIYAEWDREKAQTQAVRLFQRYPDAKLVWSGSDQMAFGAMKALEVGTDKKPGTHALFSGINTSTEAMEAVRSGRMTALAGGHFICAAWAVVMIYDYLNGKDFAQEEGLELDRPMFTLFSPDEAGRFVTRFGEMNYTKVDFRRFSKALNPKLKRYDFSFGQLVR